MLLSFIKCDFKFRMSLSSSFTTQTQAATTKMLLKENEEMRERVDGAFAAAVVAIAVVNVDDVG